MAGCNGLMGFYRVGVHGTLGAAGHPFGWALLPDCSGVSLFGVLVFWSEPILLGLDGHLPCHSLVCGADLNLFESLTCVTEWIGPSYGLSIIHRNMTHPSKRPQRLVLLVLIPLLAGVIGTVTYLRGGRIIETENAYLKADKVPVNAEISGVVKEVLVADNQQVKAGDVLFRLDPAPVQIARAKAEDRKSVV